MLSTSGTEREWPGDSAATRQPPVELPRLVRFGRDYWLNRCSGFHVETPDGHQGRVEAVLFGSRLDRPDLLVIRQGTLRRRRAIVPVDAVVEIDPVGGRLWLTLPDPGEQSRQGRVRWWRRAWSSLRLAS
jgi:hypothetical protein